MNRSVLRAPRATRVLAMLTATAFAVGACGDDDEDTDSTTAPADTASSATEGPATTAAASTAPTGSEIEIPEEFEGKVLNVALYNNAAPASFVDNGELVGYGVELTQALSETLGLEFNIEQTPSFDVLIPGLQGGRYDLAPDFFYITPERLEVVDLISMTDTAAAFGTAVDSGLVIDSADDLCGLSAATLNGSAFPSFMEAITEDCVADGKEAIETSTYPDNAAGINAVANGRADVYVATNDQIAFIGAEGQLEAQPYLYQERLEAIAVPKGSPLAVPIQQAWNQMIESGVYQDILDKWNVGAKAIERSEINPVENLE